MRPTVSVVIPVHNAACYLEQCLDSVRAQYFDDFEVLCVDDASTDSSFQILKDYAAQDSRFKVFQGTYGEPSATRNKALEHVRGNYVAFLDADDWWNPCMLKTTVSCAQANDADLVIFDYWTYHQATGKFGTYRHQEFFKRMHGRVVNVHTCPELTGFTGIWDRLFRRDVLAPHGFMNGLLYEDAVYCVDSLIRANRVAILSNHLYFYRRDVNASITYMEDASRKHEEDFLVAQAYICGCFENADISTDAWANYARYFAEYAYMHQREVHPRKRFLAFFEEVHALACSTTRPQLFELWHTDSNKAREIYIALVRANCPTLAWIHAKALNATGKLIGRR